MVVAAEDTGGKSPLGLLYDMNRLLGVVCGVFFCSVVLVMSRSQNARRRRCKARVARRCGNALRLDRQGAFTEAFQITV